MRLLRQLQRLVGRTVLGCLRLRGQQHGTAAVRRGLVDQVLTARDLQRIERRLPIAGAALQVE